MSGSAAILPFPATCQYEYITEEQFEALVLLPNTTELVDAGVVKFFSVAPGGACGRDGGCLIASTINGDYLKFQKRN